MYSNQYPHGEVKNERAVVHPRGIAQAVKSRCVDAFTTFDSRPKEVLKILKRKFDKENIPTIQQLRNFKKSCAKTYLDSQTLVSKNDYIQFLKKYIISCKEDYESLDDDDLIVIGYHTYTDV
jgi:ribosomal protein S21